MKDHEKYAEEVKQKVFETIECYDSEETKLAILYIQGQIEAIMSLELPKSDYAVKVEYLQKSINYLKDNTWQ